MNTHTYVRKFGWSSDEQQHQQTAREEGEKGTRRIKGIAERQENGRLKESAGFPLDVKAPIEAVAQRAYTPDNDGEAVEMTPTLFVDIIFGNQSDFPSNLTLISCSLIRRFHRNHFIHFFPIFFVCFFLFFFFFFFFFKKFQS